MIRLWRLLALPIFLGLFILAAYLYYYLGGYKAVVVDIVERPSWQAVYQPHRGAYHQINTVITAVEEWAKSQQISCLKTFGEYLDDPMQTDEARLKSNGGCILENNLPTFELAAPMALKTFAGGSFVHASFTGSPAIGPWKVYPKILAFIKDKQIKTASSSIEIYQINAQGKMTTEYLFPILK